MKINIGLLLLFNASGALGLRGVMEESIIASSLSYAIATLVEVVLKRKTKNLADS